MCLRQKIRCTIEGNMCELYEHKNSRELIKEESCRNSFDICERVRLIALNALPRDFLDVFGSDKCKFYLKRRKSKIV